MTKGGLVIMALIFTVAPKAHAFCFEEAGNMYNVSPQLLWTIANVESGFNPYIVNYNRNGSYDYGLMQINSSWYKTLGPELWRSLGDPCTNVKVGARILADCISRYGQSWDAVGCYNAGNPNKEAARTYVRRVKWVLASIKKQ